MVGLIFFPTVLALCETQAASFKIWTLIAESTYSDDSRYATNLCVYVFTPPH